MPKIENNRIYFKLFFKIFNIQVIYLQKADKLNIDVLKTILSMILNNLNSIIFYGSNFKIALLDFINEHIIFKKTKELYFFGCIFKQIDFNLSDDLKNIKKIVFTDILKNLKKKINFKKRIDGLEKLKHAFFTNTSLNLFRKK
ncbi:hypothetical protein CWI36_0012p0020 [Hamiltosporidium magnivora]|uniref:Uncharacterized protein n=1 Tax=Hamiltosporidium magnivora TaxID=148818 RepID=A0A4Q9LQ27_9MICR|nr:hypothetical protein CWI36_0012p0020 [Hamiltosporidium magnivora]